MGGGALIWIRDVCRAGGRRKCLRREIGACVDDSALTYLLGHHKEYISHAVIHSTSICWV